MKFGITYDANSEAGLDEVIFGLNAAWERFFGDRFYDDSSTGLFLVLMCRNPRWDFKQRIRYSKKESTLYIDIMIDLGLMSGSGLGTRRQIVAKKILNEVPEIIAKKKFKDFDLPRFTKDLREWFEDNGWLSKEFPEFIAS